MPVYHYTTTVKASLDQLSAFHSDSRILRRLTPPPLIVQIVHTDPIGEHSIVDFKLWFGPLPVHWIVEHIDVDPKHGFTDVQVKGPFKSWKHRHSFLRVSDNQSTIEDVVEAEFAEVGYKWILSRFMWLNLPVLFAYRAWIVRKSLENTIK